MLGIVGKCDTFRDQALALEDDGIAYVHLLGDGAALGGSTKHCIAQGHAVASHDGCAVGEHTRQGNAVLGQRL